MAKKSFDVGDIVKLKSGGPDMTVHSPPDFNRDYYFCQWFAGKKLESGRFLPDCLEKAEPKQNVEAPKK